MKSIAIIGGSGFQLLPGLEIREQRSVPTPFGPPSAPIDVGELGSRRVLFLARHGHPHAIPPHRVNYRANIWALRECGADRILGVNAVGGISPGAAPPRLVVPDQIIDYTWSRDHTFSGEDAEGVLHVDFTHPYDEDMRVLLHRQAAALGLDLLNGGTYGATQGPRLETAAEITRMERDGCDVVGMTGMPEAALARELSLRYVSLCIVANRAAGKGSVPLGMKLIEENLALGMSAAVQLLASIIPEMD